MISGTRDNPPPSPTPPSYPGRADFSPISLTRHAHYQLVLGRRENSGRGGGGGSCLTLVDRLTLAGGAAFFSYKHFDLLSREDFSFLRAACHVTSSFWLRSDEFSKICTDETTFKQAETTVIKSTKIS